jgi:hypothetical protein
MSGRLNIADPACLPLHPDPLTGSRGRVPRDDFEEFLKGGRATSGTISNNGYVLLSERCNSPSSLRPDLPNHTRIADQDLLHLRWLMVQLQIINLVLHPVAVSDLHQLDMYPVVSNSSNSNKTFQEVPEVQHRRRERIRRCRGIIGYFWH